MKRLSAILIVLVLVFSTVAYADEPVAEPIAEENMVNVIINDEPVEFDVPPQIIDDRTMVPMRKIFETLGAKVQWFEEDQIIFATYSSCIMTMEIGKNSFIVTDILADTEKVVELDVAPVIIDGRTLVPVRAISESMGMTVEWVEETQTVKIY